MDDTVTRERVETEKHGVNFVYDYQGSRFRTNISKDMNGVAIALRTIRKKIPTAESVGLNESITRLLNSDR